MNTLLTPSQPSLHQVFLCPICSAMFNHSTNLPLALPCGHVICKKCLTSSTLNVASAEHFKCLIDKQTFNTSVSSLKSCQAILDNLPRVDSGSSPNHQETPKQFVCKAHPTKRVKYICEYDNEVFCSNCVNSHNKHPHVMCNFLPQKEHLVNEIAFIRRRVQDKKTELNNSNKLLNDARNVLYDKTKEEITKLNNDIDLIIQMFDKCKTLYEEKIKNMLKYQLEEINESKLAINQQLLTLNELDDLINEYNEELLLNGLIYEHVIESKNKIFSQWESFLKQSNSLSSVYLASDMNYVINNITYPKVNIRKIDVVNMFEFNAESPREQTATKDNSASYSNANNNLAPQSNSNCCNNYFNFNSARNNSRINMRKGSDPTAKANNRNYPFDSKNEDKPVVLNNAPQIHSPCVEEKNIKTKKTHTMAHRSNNSNVNLNSNSNSTQTKSNSNSRKSVSSKNRDTHIVITN